MTRAMFTFPVDDYVTAEVDDATKELAEILTRYGVRGCFHLVGENARVFRARSRRDIVEALGPHDIGFHSDRHSRHPLPIVAMEHMDWDDAVERFMRDEGRGVRDVAELMDRWPTYYVHTMASAPQVVYGARMLGMRIVGTKTMDRWPLMRYAGNLLVTWDVGFDPPKLPDHEVNLEGRVERTLANFDAVAAERDPRLPIRLFTHINKYPTYVNVDSVNFSKGASPPREEWKPAPLRGEAVWRKLTEQFEELIRRLTERGDVEFMTYADVLEEFGPRLAWLTPEAVRDLASRVGDDLEPMEIGCEWLSCAEVFAVLCRFIARGGEVAVRRVLGPKQAPAETAAPAEAPADAFVAACRRVDQEIDDENAIPAALETASGVYGPGTWLRAMAAFLIDDKVETVPLPPGDEYPALLDDPFFKEPKVGWGCYPESFSGESIRQAIQWQSWSAAPAG